jgi:hypothetical protein
MGTVYAATQLDLGRQVAVKLLGEVGPGDPTLLRFEREARTAASLGHPHIVQVTDFQNVPGEVPFLVMELLQGRSLAEIVGSEGPLDPTRVARIAVQILSALSATHAVGIVHRDIKPANVMVLTSAAGELVKVVDFGIAKLLSPESGPPLTHSGVIIGTASYMAPEQAMGGAIDGRTDLYSVAACMYFALTRRKPIESLNMPAALMTEVPPPISSLRPDLDVGFGAIVMRGLAKDPALRFPNAEAMSAALDEWLTRTESNPMPSSRLSTGGAFAPTLAVSESPVVAPRPQRRSSCFVWVLAAFVLVALLVGVAVLAGGIGYYASLESSTPQPGDAGAAEALADSGAASNVPLASASQAPTTSARVAGTISRDAGAGAKATAKTGKRGGSCVGFGDCGLLETCDLTTKICVCEKDKMVMDCGTYCARRSSPRDCGACGKRCPDDNVCQFTLGAASCIPCTASPSLGSLKRMSCGVHACIDPNVDAKHCGGCNHACAKDQKCVNGQCT